MGKDGKEGLIRMAVIGYGYWGPNVVRNFSSTEGVEVVSVCDINQI